MILRLQCHFSASLGRDLDFWGQAVTRCIQVSVARTCKGRSSSLKAQLFFLEQTPSLWCWRTELMWTAHSDTACFLDELRGGRKHFFFACGEFFALCPRPFLLEEQPQHCVLEMLFAYPSQVPSVSSLVSSTTVWQFPKPMCEELRSSEQKSSKQSRTQSVSVLAAITTTVCQAPSTPSYPS